MPDETAEALEPSEGAPASEETQTPESVDTASTDDAVAETTEAPEPEKKQSRRDKRIDQLTGKNYALTEDRDYWRNKALAQPEPTKAPEPKAEPPKKPVLADFQHDIEAYAGALADYTEKSIDFAKNEVATEIKQTAKDASDQQTLDSHKQQRLDRFKEKSEEFAKDTKDYFEIVQNDSLNISPNMMDIMLELENTPGVLYHLGMHPEVAHRIAQKSPVAAAIELGRIETSLTKSPASATTSNAPEPPNPISTSRGTTDRKITDPTLTDKQYRDMRKKQIAAR